MRTIAPLPSSVKNGLKKLGQDVRKARLRRKYTMELMATRASISRVTLTKVEKGDPSVAIGIYAKVLFVMSLDYNLSELLSNDPAGLAIVDQDLPKRIRNKK